MEYLFIMGLAILLIAPLLVIYYQQTARLGDETNSAMIQRAATQIVEAADSVYYLGAPSMRTITIDLPANIESLSIAGQSVTFTLSSNHGDYEQAAWSVTNLTGDFGITKGPHILVLQALDDDRVNITEQAG